MTSDSGEEWGELISTSDKGRFPVKLVKAKCVIGRARDCDLHVESRLVSGHHCYLLRDDDGNVWVHDTSTNSTYINKTTQVSNGSRHLLKDGDEVFLVMRKNNPDANLSFVFKCCDENKLEDDTQECTLDASDGDCLQNKSGDAKTLDCNEIPEEPVNKRAKVCPSDERPQLTSHVSQTPGPSQLPVAKPGADSSQKDGRKDTMGDSLLCCICYEILHDCISLQPCMHSFCSGCYSLWMKKSNECPQCRNSVQRVCKNHILNNLVEAYLKDHPEKMRSNSELEELNTKNTITHDMLYPKKSSSPKFWSDSGSSDSDNSEQSCSCDACTNPSQNNLHCRRLPHRPRNQGAFLGYCRQCPAYQGPHRLPPPETTGVNEGSQSSASSPSQEAADPSTTRSSLPSTSNDALAPAGVVTIPHAVLNHVCRPAPVHILCQCCMEPMPDRRMDKMVLENEQLPDQQCSLCLRFYCHLYWGCKNAGCLGCLNTFRHMNFGDRCLAGLINENVHESQIFADYLTAQGLTWKDVLQECLQRLEGEQYTCAPAVTGETVLCYSCALASFRQLSYSYRKDIPADQLPAVVRSRPNCYWGRNCRTQKTRPHHAQNFNHVCEQTRF